MFDMQCRFVELPDGSAKVMCGLKPTLQCEVPGCKGSVVALLLMAP